MKKSWPLFALFVLSISFVSAGLFDSFGYYGDFSISGIFDQISSQDMILTITFVVLFLFIASSLKRVGIFRNIYGYPDTGTIGIIAFCVAAGAAYGIYYSGYIYEIENWFYDFDLTSPYVVITVVIISLFLIYKFFIRGRRHNIHRPRTI
jgi:uncharacterized membrane protein